MGEYDLYGTAASVAPGDTFLVRRVAVTPPAAGTIQQAPGALVSALASADIARVFIAGHSYAAGYGNVEGGERWPTRLAASLHAEEVTYAVTSAILAQDSSVGGAGSGAGGYANVLNALTPRVSDSGRSYAVRNSSPYLPLSPVTVFDYGFNDLWGLTAVTATNVAWFTMALQACICIARAGGWFPDTDSSVAYGSGWTASTGEQSYGPPTNHGATATGSHLTITTPADFPGGEADILTLAYSGGAKWSTVVDGGPAQVLDGTSSAYGSNSGRANLVVQRLTGLSAGAHTIVMTLAAIDGGGAVGIFAGWMIASPWVPTVALVNMPFAPALPSTQAGKAHTPVTSGDVTALNTAIAGIPAGFDLNVALADIATAFANASGNVAYTSPGSLYWTDNLHPNAAGHALIAQTVLAAVRSAPAPSAARVIPMGMLMRQIGGPLEPQLSSGWSVNEGSPFGGGWGWFAKDRAGNTWMSATLQKSSAGSVAEHIVELPPGYQPGAPAFVAATSWDSGYSAPSAGVVGAGDDQNVIWLSGDPTTELDFTCVWPAGGLAT